MDQRGAINNFTTNLTVDPMASVDISYLSSMLSNSKGNIKKEVSQMMVITSSIVNYFDDPITRRRNLQDLPANFQEIPLENVASIVDL